jgi:hypothetical protein
VFPLGWDPDLSATSHELVFTTQKFSPVFRIRKSIADPDPEGKLITDPAASVFYLDVYVAIEKSKMDTVVCCQTGTGYRSE